MTKWETYQQEAIDEEVDVRPHGVSDTGEIQEDIQRRIDESLPANYAVVRSLVRPASTDQSVADHVRRVLANNPSEPIPPTPPPPSNTLPNHNERIEHWIPAALEPPQATAPLEPFSSHDFIAAPFRIATDIPHHGVCHAATADMGRRAFVMLTGAILGGIIFATGK